MAKKLNMKNKIKNMMSKKNKKDKHTATEEVEQHSGVAQDPSKVDIKKSSETENGRSLAEVTKERDDLRDKYLRLLAEFDNYKKRTVKERINLMKNAAQDTLSALLPVLDDFDRAKKNAQDDNSDEHLSEGVLLVYNKLYSILKQRGLIPMETDGETFDPEYHEAVTEIPAPSEDLKGKIIDTVEKGYFLNDKIIRHAKVVVGK